MPLFWIEKLNTITKPQQNRTEFVRERDLVRRLTGCFDNNSLLCWSTLTEKLNFSLCLLQAICQAPIGYYPTVTIQWIKIVTKRCLQALNFVYTAESLGEWTLRARNTKYKKTGWWLQNQAQRLTLSNRDDFKFLNSKPQTLAAHLGSRSWMS